MLRIEMEEDFEIAAISAGLMERVADALTIRWVYHKKKIEKIGRPEKSLCLP